MDYAGKKCVIRGREREKEKDEDFYLIIHLKREIKLFPAIIDELEEILRETFPRSN